MASCGAGSGTSTIGHVGMIPPMRNDRREWCSSMAARLRQVPAKRRQRSMADRRAFLYSVDPDARGPIIAWLAGTGVGLEAHQDTIPIDRSA